MRKIYIAVAVLLVSVLFAIFNNFSSKVNEAKAFAFEMESRYNKYVVTNKNSNLYDANGNEVGIVSKDTRLVLDAFNNSEYYKIKDLDLYINFADINKINKFIYNERYKYYIPFNINIKTKDNTKFFDENDKLVYSINRSYEFTVIIKDNYKYGILFNNQLLYIKLNDIASIYNNANTVKNKKNIRTITYHFLYDPNKRLCDEAICLTLSKFEEQLKYIRDNDYFTLTLDELELYMDGKLQIPNKSIVLTIDDGTVIDQKVLDLLEKYKVNMTLFLITGWMDKSLYQSKYLELESHTNDMHTANVCKGYGLQGAGILCLPKEDIVYDLKESQRILGGSKYFAYPLFDYNERAISILKEVGFHMAFVGALDTDGISTPGITDKYKMRRKTMFSNVDLNEFVFEYLN